jgi:recombinational DNA repair protein (RecF pathway)
MIDWKDQGFLIHLAPLGERRTLATFLTENRGRHRGILKTRPMGLMLGVHSALTWTSRLEDNLGTLQVEPSLGALWQSMTHGLSMQAIGSMCALSHWLAPERVPMPMTYQAFGQAAAQMATAQGLSLYDGFEHTLLYELGYVAMAQSCPHGLSRGGPVQTSAQSHPLLERLKDRQNLLLKLYPQLSFLHTMRQNFLHALFQSAFARPGGPAGAFKVF